MCNRDGSARRQKNAAPKGGIWPEPIIGAQRVTLSLDAQRITLATDGLGPFAVAADPPVQASQ